MSYLAVEGGGGGEKKKKKKVGKPIGDPVRGRDAPTNVNTHSTNVNTLGAVELCINYIGSATKIVLN